jgi:hypothetical protein
MAKNLEQNNIEAQLKLCKDIIKKYEDIIYHVKEKGVELQRLVSNRKYDSKEPIETRTENFTNKVVEDILDIAINLSNESKFEKLGILANNVINEIKTKKDILEILNK